MPQRIQRKRAKGWRMPPGVVYVGRGSQWGNPFDLSVIHHAAACGLMEHDVEGIDAGRVLRADAWVRPCCEAAVALYRGLIEGATPEERETVVAPLRGKDLACWCPPDQPCHADVLIEIANR